MAFYYVRRDMPEAQIRAGAAYLARTERLDRIVALDDFDVETAAMLREYPGVPGMGQTRARGFRDKLAMRTRARAAAIPCPEFVHALNHQAIADWTQRIPPPWVLKPRSQAAAIGIRKLASHDELWRTLEELGDAQADYVLEQFVPGDVYHVDSISFDGRIRFAMASRYRMPPMAVAHEGGIFVTSTLSPSDTASAPLHALNEQVLASFQLGRGASHTEFIHARDGSWLFLETSARVGGAYIVDVVEAATGVNLWREWARTEIAGEGGSYELPPVREHQAGIVLSLARQEWPDTSVYQDPEIVSRIRRIAPRGSDCLVRPAGACRRTARRLRRTVSQRTSMPPLRLPSDRSTDAGTVIRPRHEARARAGLVASARERARHRHLPASLLRRTPDDGIRRSTCRTDRTLRIPSVRSPAPGDSRSA